eukprot:TRINITY_DN11491_c0_g1_i1.p1 TRINITY_DN11491_c0_g1~~TRINITY_DN11491_c0_g1_i1.p1  ORF type:complete len:971 (+),score=225.24 TRINITY_DN11491_c0_g1_i1:170-3082(+)
MAMSGIDPAFLTLGPPKEGMWIWRIENLAPVPLKKEEYGRFHTGDSYIVLKTVQTKSGGFNSSIHFWLGKESSQDEMGCAALKSVELDAHFSGKAVQYREVQGQESDLFLSYFRPCIIALPGGVASGFKKVEESKKKTKLYQVKGKRSVRVREVPCARSSLNHGDVFIMDTANKIYQFNGVDANRAEKGRALDVTAFLKSEHKGDCPVAIVEDGKMEDDDATEFWDTFGGFGPIAKRSVLDDDEDVKASPAKLSKWTKAGSTVVATGGLKRSMLDNGSCYLMDTGGELFVWTGRLAPPEDKTAALYAAEDLLTKEKRASSTRLTRLSDKYETPMFKSHFDEWPLAMSTADRSSSKLKGMLKSAGIQVDVKSMARPTERPKEETNIPPLTDVPGKIEVWRIDNHDKQPVPPEEVGYFYSGDCYIVLYTYARERKNEYLICFWLGRNSTQDEKGTAAILATKMTETLRGNHILVRVVQGKEPEQFLGLFKGNLFFLKGGLGSSYKTAVGSADDTYTPKSSAMFSVKENAAGNIRVTQVELVAKSLNSSDSFVVHTATAVFVWVGQYSTEVEKQRAMRAAEVLKPGVAPKIQVEGKEVAPFWAALGGKAEYANSPEAAEIGKDPRLFVVSNATGTMRVTEVFNYTQEELISDDVMVLDAYSTIFVWVGSQSNDAEKKGAFDIGQQYLDFVVSSEGRSKDTTLVKVNEGNEPPMFTAHFQWDATKSAAFVDPYARKLAELQGKALEVPETRKFALRDASSRRLAPPASPNAPPKEAPLREGVSSVAQESSAAAAPASPVPASRDHPTEEPAAPTTPASQRAAALAALSGALVGEKQSAGSKVFKPASSPISAPAPTPPPSVAATSPPPKPSQAEATPEPPTTPVTSEPPAAAEASASAPVAEPPAPAANGAADSIPYERLILDSTDPAPGIDTTKRESYLSDADFVRFMKSSKEEFYALPKWKQDQKKRLVSLF